MSDVLAIGPHPDDIELSAGGTMALLAAAGLETAILDLTAGERGTRGTPETRAAEAAQAAEALGVARRETLGLPDGGLDARDPGQLAALVEALRRHRPRLVVGMHWNDDHADHIEAGEMVRRAAYLAGLRNYPERDHEPHRPERVLFAMGRRPFTPSLVVDVTAHYETKRRAVAAYASQFHRDPGDPLVTRISDPGFLELVEARDRVYGARIHATYGEPFFEVGPVPVRRVSDLWGEDRA